MLLCLLIFDESLPSIDDGNSHVIGLLVEDLRLVNGIYSLAHLCLFQNTHSDRKSIEGLNEVSKGTPSNQPFGTLKRAHLCSLLHLLGPLDYDRYSSLVNKLILAVSLGCVFEDH